MPADSPVSQNRSSFFDLDSAGLEAVVQSWGWPGFRAKQVQDWVYRKLVIDPYRMSNLSKRDRDTLAQNLSFALPKTIRRQDSSDGTIKLLLGWGEQDFTAEDAEGRRGLQGGSGIEENGDAASFPLIQNPKSTPGGPRSAIQNPATAETVMIPDGPRRTACISSQVGCPVGCRFCASGIGGVKGNLSAGQIVQQVYALNLALAAEMPANPEPDLVNHIVFMGMGEPLANYAAVMQAVRILHDPRCFDIGARKITVSTVGVPPRMRDLANEDLPLNLAISLHAPNEELRRQLIPWAEHFTIEQILDAGRYYFERTGREITLEYILLANVNDRPEHVRDLAKLCKTLRANVNLIRYNEVEGLPYERPETSDVLKFQEILRKAGVNAHVRKSRGRDIDAACGQLRRKQATG